MRFLLVLMSLGLVSCGDVQLIVERSSPQVILPTRQLPRNLLASEALPDAPTGRRLTVSTDWLRVTITDMSSGPVATVVAGGSVHATAPVDIVSFQVLATPVERTARWEPVDEVGSTHASFPSQMAAGDEGRWAWVSRSATDGGAFAGIEFQTEVVYEILF